MQKLKRRKITKNPFQPVSLVNTWLWILLHNQLILPVCNDRLEQVAMFLSLLATGGGISHILGVGYNDWPTILRLVPVAIVVFRYLMVCQAVWCQNLGGERPLWRIVSWWWQWCWYWWWWCWCCSSTHDMDLYFSDMDMYISNIYLY